MLEDSGLLNSAFTTTGSILNNIFPLEMQINVSQVRSFLYDLIQCGPKIVDAIITHEQHLKRQEEIDAKIQRLDNKKELFLTIREGKITMEDKSEQISKLKEELLRTRLVYSQIQHVVKVAETTQENIAAKASFLIPECEEFVKAVNSTLSPHENSVAAKKELAETWVTFKDLV